MCDNTSILLYDSKLMRDMILSFKNLKVEQAESFYECAISQELFTLLCKLRTEFPELTHLLNNRLSQLGYKGA